ncbi:zinc finger Ran-binding domain-containing protein 2-like isoform X2 [Carassius gibelio]|uniref:zinc finger Ran-binding domain-containing protein 2-like isoform X2 n=1 Tax=Carassius gibelio TaxID=101364 RepID=UPI002279C4B3|nr:zinc finger Ran-binding domain-containing protein 2-like isoform X2 [Carassius gibelio]
MSAKSFRVSDGDWVCPDKKCGNVNFARRTSCNRCGREKTTEAKMMKAGGTEIGKTLAEKSKGLFSANDWQCKTCGNVNWARRSECNMCNTPKYAKLEERTGYGGGFNERENLVYNEREESDGEYDEFGRIKKKYRGKSTKDTEKKEEPKKNNNNNEEEEEEDEDDEDGDLSKYKLDDDDEDDADLSKYELDDSEEKKGTRSSSSRSSSRSSSSSSRSRSRSRSRSSSSSRSCSRSRSNSRSSSRSGKGSVSTKKRSRSPSSSPEGGQKRSRSRSSSGGRKKRRTRSHSSERFGVTHGGLDARRPSALYTGLRDNTVLKQCDNCSFLCTIDFSCFVLI